MGKYFNNATLMDFYLKLESEVVYSNGFMPQKMDKRLHIISYFHCMQQSRVQAQSLHMQHGLFWANTDLQALMAGFRC